MNSEGVIDSLGSSIVFFVPSLVGALYSAILFATSPYGPDNTDATAQMLAGRSRWEQGGYQLAGLGITIGIAFISGLLIGGFSKIINQIDGPEDLFNDHKYIEQDFSTEVKQSKEVRVERWLWRNSPNILDILIYLVKGIMILRLMIICPRIKCCRSSCSSSPLLRRSRRLGLDVRFCYLWILGLYSWRHCYSWASSAFSTLYAFPGSPWWYRHRHSPLPSWGRL